VARHFTAPQVVTLDALTRADVQRLLEAVWVERKFTAVLITDDVEEAIAIADRALLLEGSRIANG